MYLKRMIIQMYLTAWILNVVTDNGEAEVVLLSPPTEDATKDEKV